MAENLILYLATLASTLGVFTPNVDVSNVDVSNVDEGSDLEYDLNVVSSDNEEEYMSEVQYTQLAEEKTREGILFCREYICILTWCLIDCFRNVYVSTWYNSVGPLSQHYLNRLFGYRLIDDMQHFDSTEFKKQLSKLFFECLKFLCSSEKTFELIRVAEVLS